MKKLFTWFILSMALSPSYCQSLSHKIPGGIVYQITIRNSTYKFNHANYSVFIPDNVQKIKGLFIHQHGCTMEGRGVASAYDIQYQAFASKWHLAIIGPDLYPQSSHGCEDWINPEDGSGPALLAALDSIAQFSQHPEIVNAPWLLWGHSGGGYWVLAMINAYPDLIIGAVCYSPAFDPHFSYSEGAAKIPIMIRHAGSTDYNDPGVNCWGTALHTFSILRKMHGLASIAYIPNETHNLSYLRYMAIPFYESVLSQRLPINGSSVLQDMDMTKGWLCDTVTTGMVQIYKESEFKGNKKTMSWLPDSLYAVNFREYLKSGIVQDVTAPLAPENLKLVKSKDAQLELMWKAEADIESGIKYFNIYKNGQLLGRYPTEVDFQTFDTNGDDAVPVNPPAMIYRISEISENGVDTIAVTSVNRFNLESPRSELIYPNLSK